MEIMKGVEGAKVSACFVMVDRKEKGQGEKGAMVEIEEEFGFPVYSVVDVYDIIEYLEEDEANAENVARIEKYRETYGKDPSQFAADGYDAIYVIFEAMKAAGVDDVNISASDLCNKVVAAITASSFQYVGTTGTMTWDASGAATKVPVIVELQ
jgi:ABC-type branched-subunit amino acid transport system substrate-binding protein